MNCTCTDFECDDCQKCWEGISMPETVPMSPPSQLSILAAKMLNGLIQNGYIEGENL